ncbi:MAG: hypothetical protein R2827_02365 [Bdellovibrionales bacterium]
MQSGEYFWRVRPLVNSTTLSWSIPFALTVRRQSAPVTIATATPEVAPAVETPAVELEPTLTKPQAPELAAEPEPLIDQKLAASTDSKLLEAQQTLEDVQGPTEEELQFANLKKPESVQNPPL